MTTLLTRDREALWHPFTQHQRGAWPIPIARAEGAYLYDTEGKAYLDLISSWWVTIHGHAHPEIAKAIYEQALQVEHVMFAGFTHQPAVDLAEQLMQVMNPPSQKIFSKVFYSDNGATAVEIAIKMAYQYWHNQGQKRQRFLALEGAYHGDTFGAMAFSTTNSFTKPFKNLLFSVDYAPFPETWQGDEEVTQKEAQSLDWIKTYLEAHHQELAAIFVEPLIQGVGGLRLCRPEYLQALEALCRPLGILIIYDEVMTGFGRTGLPFAFQHAATQPDIICLAKGISGGFLPLAATVCQEKIYQAFLGDTIDSALLHGHSYTANPLGCAAGLASLRLLLKPETQAQIQMISQTHEKALAELRTLPILEKCRFLGTLLAMDVKGETAYGSNFSLSLLHNARERGLIIRPFGKTIHFLPPYCISRAELERAYKQLIEMLANLTIKESA